MAFVNISNVARPSIAEHASALVKSVMDSLARRRIYRQTVRELNALSTRELADLGIHRSMITRIALEAAYAK